MLNFYNAQEASMIGDVARSIPRIYATMDNCQVDHPASIVEMEGKLKEKFISILIDPSSNYIYVIIDIVDKCGLGKDLHE